MPRYARNDIGVVPKVSAYRRLAHLGWGRRREQRAAAFQECAPLHRERVAPLAEPRQFRAAAHAELAVDRVQVDLDGPRRDPERDGDLLVRETARREVEGLVLPRAERLEPFASAACALLVEAETTSKRREQAKAWASPSSVMGCGSARLTRKRWTGSNWALRKHPFGKSRARQIRLFSCLGTSECALAWRRLYNLPTADPCSAPRRPP